MSKRCIACETENDDDSKRCFNCGHPFKELSAGAEQKSISWCITCPCCGKKYYVANQYDRISQCENCADEVDKYRIAEIAPVKIEKMNNSQNTVKERTEVAMNQNRLPLLKITEIWRKITIEIKKEVIIGREFSDIAGDLFASDEYISTPHCRIFYDGSEWKIEDLDSLNKTIVDKVELPPFFPVALYDGHFIRLADLVFRISMEEAVHDTLKNEIAEADQTWAIRCPVCGTYYEVDGPLSHISECSGACKSDVFDRYGIGKESPRKVDASLIEKMRVIGASNDGD